MSGSMRWFNYVSDDGKTYAIKGDKTNIIAVNPSAASIGTLPTAAVPSNIKPRYALFSSDDGKIRRKVVILTPTDLAALTAAKNFTPTEETVSVTISSIRGEKLTLPKIADTGRTN